MSQKTLLLCKLSIVKDYFLVSIEAQASYIMTKFPYEVISFDIKHVHQANVVILQITV